MSLPQPFMQQRGVWSLLAAAIGVRVLSAWWGYGLHAQDDYFHLLDPAYALILDPNFDWFHSTLSGAKIRSYLVPWFLSQWLSLWGTPTEPIWTLRLCHGLLGGLNLLTLPFVYHIGCSLHATASATETTATSSASAQRSGMLSAALYALHPLSFYMGTRLLLESMAIPFLVSGLALALRCDKAPTHHSSIPFVHTMLKDGVLFKIIAGGFLLGIAAWIRYQTLAFSLPFLCLLPFWNGRTSMTKQPRTLLLVGGLTGLCIALLLQGWFDLFTCGEFLAPLRNNIATNLCSAWRHSTNMFCTLAQQHGVFINRHLSKQGPDGYLLLLVGASLFPINLFVFKASVQVAKKNWHFSLAILAFIIVHFLIPHKEERFLFSVLPFLWCIVSAGLMAAPFDMSETSPLKKAVLGCGLALHLVAAIALLGGGPQQHLLRALPHIHGDHIITATQALPTHWLPNPSATITKLRRPALTPEQQRAVTQTQTSTWMIHQRPEWQVWMDAQTAQLQCGPSQVFAPWWVDHLVYVINPKHNRRRAPIVMRHCVGQ